MPQRDNPGRSQRSTRERIVDLIRQAPLTAREVATRLGMTYHAVRQHLLSLEREGMIRASAVRGVTRPANVYDINPAAEPTLSRAYVPFASHLTRVLSERLPERQLSAIMRDVGRRLAASFPKPRGTLRERALAASEVLRDLGSPNEVRGRGAALTISSPSCVLAAAIHGQPAVCNAMATFLGDYLDADVRQRCDRGERPRCCFEISPRALST